MSKSETRLLSGTYAERILRREPRVRELPAGFQQQDLGEDRDRDLPGRLVAEAKSDGRVQAGVLARIASEPAGDVAQDQGHLPAAADQPDIPRFGPQRGLEHALVQRMAAGEDHDEVAR